MGEERFVVIGAQAAGMSAASQAKRRSPDTAVTVYEGGVDVSCLLCGLPYFLGGVVEDIGSLVQVGKDTFINKRGIGVLTGHDVLSVDIKNRRLHVKSRATGQESNEAFDKLCIATGAVPIQLEIPGFNLPGVFHLRTPRDALKIHGYIADQKPRTVAIVGGGYIGLEMAENLSHLGMSVTIIERLSSVMSHIGPEIGRLVAQTLERSGVRIFLDMEIEELDGSNRVRCVRTPVQDLDADMVILATGISPNSRLGLEAGLPAGAEGTIAVNARQETAETGIFAAGDCAESLDLVTGRKVFVPLGTTANKQGRVAGANAVGGDETFRGTVGTRIVRVFGLEVARAGLTIDEALGLGYRAEAKVIKSYSRANYFPGGGETFVKIVCDTETERILGAQIAGPEGVKGRIDVFVAALTRHMTVSEFSDLDLAYSPPFSPVWDPVLVASNVAKRKTRGGDV